MFKIKICGVTDADTAAFCCSSGADAIGLNFYQKSKRFVGDQQAVQISRRIGSSALKVGLFVNLDKTELLQRVNELQLDAVQLHGDESVELLNELQSLPPIVKVIRAVRIGNENLSVALNEIEQWSSHSAANCVGAILLDPFVAQSYGGTGQRIDWDWLAGIELPTDKPVVLAGGLNPDNVAEAISIVRPAGVDVAGGVEAKPGIKSQQLIESFITNATESFDRT